MSPELESVRFYKLHRSDLISYADSFVRDRASAEDIVQDAWERVQAVEQGRLLAEPIGYFYRTVRNLALDWLRARKLDSIEADSDPIELAATLQDQSPSPEATVSARKDLHLVLESLDELPERSRLALTLFDLTKKNVSTPDPANPGFNIQEGQTRSRGVELEAKVALAQNLDLMASYTWNDVKVKKTTEPDIVGKRPVRVPEHMASVWVDYRLPASGPLAGLRVGGGVRYVGDSYGDRENTFKVSSYTVMDAMVRYEFTPGRGLALTLNASNLFDKQYVASCYSLVGCQYGQGRTVYATMEYSW